MTNSEIKKQLAELAAKVVESQKGVKVGNVIKIGKWAVVESISTESISTESIIISVKYLSPNGGFKGYTCFNYKALENGPIFSSEDIWRKSINKNNL